MYKRSPSSVGHRLRGFFGGLSCSLLLAAGSATAFTTPDVFVAVGVDPLTKLSSRDGTVYWKTPCSTTSMEEYPSRSRIAYKPALGGNQGYLYYPPCGAQTHPPSFAGFP